MIVSNASPLIYLGKIGKIELLRELFSHVFIPFKVYSEIMEMRESVEAILLEKAFS